MSTSTQSREVLSDSGSKDDGLQNQGKSPGCIMRLIQSHYNTKSRLKSPEQIAREAYLIPGILLFNRWYSMPAAIIIQFCCGSLYSWSVFNKPIDTLLETDNLAPITFYIAVGLFGTSAALMGPWLERNGPMISCFLGTSLFFAGNLLTALALQLKIIWLVYIGYGIISGFGLGLCYISPVSALQKWFPDKRGLASGFAVCGFGAGSIVIAKIQIPLIDAVGLPWTFVVLGCFYFILMSISALVLRTPPPHYSVTGSAPKPEVSKDQLEIAEPGKPESEIVPTAAIEASLSEPQFTLIEALTSADFRCMYIMFLANAIFGLVVISRLSNMITDIFEKSAETASTVVSVNGAFNLGGRLIFSIVSDYIGRKNCYIIMLTSQLIILGIFSTITTTKAYNSFLVIIWILTACYGAGFGVIPAFLTDKFGPNNIGACHGVILTAWSFSGVVGGLIFSAVFTKLSEGLEASDPHPYNINVWWLFSVVVVGWVSLTIFVKSTRRDEYVTRVPRAVFVKILSSLGLSKRAQNFNLADNNTV